MSATRDSMLADPEQLIADLRRQLAECKAERDQALQRETATAEVLQVINSSPGDLAPVFDAILDKATIPRTAKRARPSAPLLYSCDWTEAARPIGRAAPGSKWRKIEPSFPLVKEPGPRGRATFAKKPWSLLRD
jgi:hypothetical protein